MMRLSEIYASLQGEGPRVGLPTIFVRFAGCNLRCPGWPCDTPYAIDPATSRKEWLTRTPHQIAEDISMVIATSGATNICFTGGEPFLQPSEEFHKLLVELVVLAQGLTFEAFTNGTLEWPTWRCTG